MLVVPTRFLLFVTLTLLPSFMAITLTAGRHFVASSIKGTYPSMRDTARSDSETKNLELENQPKAEVVDVSIDLDNPVNHLGSRFVGVTIDDEQVKVNWSTLDFNSRKVQNMARALSPTYFRLGGTTADLMTYNLTGHDQDHQRSLHVPKSSGFCMTEAQWRQVNDFSRSVGWDLIMDLNALKRNTDATWNPDNARQLLSFSAYNGYSIAGFELGNEYDLYGRSFNVTVTPEQLATDVASLRQLLDQFPQYRSSFIIGPETAGMTQHFFQGFLAAGGSKVVRAASFHFYYFSGQSGEAWRFTDVKTMQELAVTLDTVVKYTKSVDPKLPIWLSETSSTYDSGTPNVSDRFVAGFLWLDKLGLSAEKGIETVIRQDFYGGNYALINKTLDPNPDFFLTVLYKRLVTGAVFRVTVKGMHSDVRVYAACSKEYNGGVVVYALNPQAYPITVGIQQLQSSSSLAYVLTSTDPSDLYSRSAALNGVTLQLINDDVPPLIPATAPSGPFTLPPYSLAFLVFPRANVASCRTKWSN